MFRYLCKSKTVSIAVRFSILMLLSTTVYAKNEAQADTVQSNQSRNVQLRSLNDQQALIEMQKLQQGGYRLLASIRIDADVPIVWDVLKDCGQALQYAPGMRACEILESGDDYDIARHKIKKYRLLPATDYIFRSDYRPYEKVLVQLVEGDLRQLNGEWQFQSCGEHCAILSYDFHVEASWIVPDHLERKALQEDIPEMLERLKHQAEQWQQTVLELQR